MCVVCVWQDFDRPFENGAPSIVLATPLTRQKDSVRDGPDPYEEVLASYAVGLHSVTSAGFALRVRRVDQWELQDGTKKSFVNWFYILRVHFLAIKV